MGMHAARLESSQYLQKMLRLFQRGGEYSTRQIAEHIGSVCGSTRIGELRRNGFDIVRRQVGQVHYYRLAGVSHGPGQPAREAPAPLPEPQAPPPAPAKPQAHAQAPAEAGPVSEARQEELPL